MFLHQIYMFVNNTFHGTTVDDKNLNAINIKFWLRWNAFLTNIPWRFCTNRNIFHGDIKENVNGCFFLNTVYILHTTQTIYLGRRINFLDPETGPQWPRTLFLFLCLFLGLLLSYFQSTKAFSFQNRSSLNFAYRLNTIFSTVAPCRIFKLSPN